MPTSKTNSKLLLLPGGPCISGAYLDYYLKFSNINAERLIYINHESLYKSGKGPNFKEVCDETLKYIERSNEPLTVIGHSYGGMIALSLLENEIYIRNVTKTILVSVPMNKRRSDEFETKLSSIPSFPINSNQDYTQFLEKILPLYFHDESMSQKFLFLFKSSYFKGNENAAPSSEQVDNFARMFSNSKNNVYSILGSNDLLLRNPLINIRTFLIQACGHFPMLEKPKEFTSIIETILDSE